MGGDIRKSAMAVRYQVENCIILSIFQQHPHQTKERIEHNGEQKNTGKPFPIHTGDAEDGKRLEGAVSGHGFIGNGGIDAKQGLYDFTHYSSPLSKSARDKARSRERPRSTKDKDNRP